MKTSTKSMVTPALLILALAVGGCATTGGGNGKTTSGKKDMSKVLYLRGQFAWWDAKPEYKVKAVGDDLYRTEVKLKADGQPYEFKFGDASWSAGTNCGYQTKKDKDLKLGQHAVTNCSSVFENFRFTPPETATYGFYFDNSGKKPEVYIKKAK